MPPVIRVIASPAFTNRSGNPYNWLLYRQLQRLGVRVTEYTAGRLFFGRHDIWHLHWPDGALSAARPARSLLRAGCLLALQRWAALRGIRVIWTIHNTRSHDARHPLLEHLFWPVFLRRVDTYISLSRAGAAVAANQLQLRRGAPQFVIPHGHYRDAYPCRGDKQAARAQLNIAPTSKLMLHFGQIREYKGIPALIRCFRQLQRAEAMLVVAGEIKSAALGEQIRAMAGDDPRVRLQFGFMDQDTLLRHLHAADLVVLPYRAVLNSGSLLMALSCDRPVLVSDSPVTREQQALVGSTWLRTCGPELTAKELAEALDWAGQSRTSSAPLDTFSWEGIAESTLHAYRMTLAGTESAVYEHASSESKRHHPDL